MFPTGVGMNREILPVNEGTCSFDYRFFRHDISPQSQMS